MRTRSFSDDYDYYGEGYCEECSQGRGSHPGQETLFCEPGMLVSMWLKEHYRRTLSALNAQRAACAGMTARIV
jgi:hypothetical protein